VERGTDEVDLFDLLPGESGEGELDEDGGEESDGDERVVGIFDLDPGELDLLEFFLREKTVEGKRYVGEPSLDGKAQPLDLGNEGFELHLTLCDLDFFDEPCGRLAGALCLRRRCRPGSGHGGKLAISLFFFARFGDGFESFANGEDGILAVDPDRWARGQEILVGLGLVNSPAPVDRLIDGSFLVEARTRV
jgi:hypothetical protein